MGKKPREIKGYINFCGENVVDMMQVRPGNDGTARFAAHLGGSAFNAAIGAAKLVRAKKLPIGIRYIGVVSLDQFGEQFMATMAKAGIDTSLAVRNNSFTTKAYVTSTVEGGERKNGFSFNRDVTNPGHLELAGKIESINAAHPNIFAFGCISSVMDPDHKGYFEAGEAAYNKGGAIYYDYNTRPQLIASIDQYRHRVCAWHQLSGIIKMSVDDLHATRPNADITLDSISSRDSNRIFIMTDGGKGAEASFHRTQSGFQINLAAKPLNAPNTVGAGDNFNAGLLVNLASNGLWTPTDWFNITAAQMGDALKAGNNAARQHLLRQGATAIHAVHSRGSR